MKNKSERLGRPPVEDPKSVALRVADHRAQLQAEGWKRADVLVPTSIRAEVEQIAKDECAGYADTLSALLQYGLDQYKANTQLVAPLSAQSADSVVFGSQRSQAASALSASGAVASSISSHNASFDLSSETVVPVRALRSSIITGKSLASALPLNKKSPISTYLRKKKES